MKRRAPSGLFEPAQLVQSFPEALRKLHPRVLVKNPVLFVVSVGAVLTTLSAVLHPAVFTWVISAWLWLTVIFANLAEAVAEGRGKAQAESLRRARTDTVALRLRHWNYRGPRPHRELVLLPRQPPQPPARLDRRFPTGARVRSLRGRKSDAARPPHRIASASPHVPDQTRARERDPKRPGPPSSPCRSSTAATS